MWRVRLGERWFGRTASDAAPSCPTFENAIRFKSNLCVKLPARGRANGRTAERTDDETNYLCAGPTRSRNSLLINRLISNLGIRRVSALSCELPTCFVSLHRCVFDPRNFITFKRLIVSRDTLNEFSPFDACNYYDTNILMLGIRTLVAGRISTRET